MPLGTDHALREPVVQTMNDISLLVHNGVVEVSLDLAEQRGTDLVCYVLLLLLGDPILLVKHSKN